MPMSIDNFRRLKKLLTLATSDNDSESLSSFRAATKIVTSSGFTWEMIMNRMVSVVQEVEPTPAGDDDLEAAFDLALRNASGEFRGVLNSIREQYHARGFVSPRQRAIVIGAADRVAERHPGGRVR